MTELSLRQMKKEWHGSLASYVIGFIACLILTSLSFLLVVSEIIAGTTLAFALAILAIIQAVFQLLFFLHVGQEAKPRWETLTFCFMLVILLVITLGSLWIMHDLNERTMIEMTVSHD